MADKKIEVSVISPEKILFSGEADYLVVPGINGEMGILWNHAPIISELGIGVIEIMDNNDPILIVVDGGFIEVKNNQVNILANGGEKRENINLEAAENMLEEVSKLPPSLEKIDKIKRAKTRISILN